MPDSSIFILVPIFIFAIALGFSNGFNDAANTVATAISTRALSPKQAIILAAIFNMLGAATGLAVARTIGKGILIPEAITYPTIIGGVAAVVVWTVLATRYGMPVSITHGLVSGLAAAGMATTGSGAIVWSVLQRVLVSVVSAPALGFIGGFGLMIMLYWFLRPVIPGRLRVPFSRLQIISSAFMAYSHGKNDGQMPIGIMTMGLVLYFQDASFWDRLSFGDPIGRWIIIVSALAISSGMATGGWRVIKTIGMRITNLNPVQGFAAQMGAAGVIEIASNLGIPVSTTHCISTSIMGVGAARRMSAVRWGVARSIVATWVVTFPVCGILGYLFSRLLGLIL
ncbi:MAG: inorganic phosphate transporter [Dehalococcoidales bacterium]|jgi:PiT family inorganic phosphate transporter